MLWSVLALAPVSVFCYSQLTLNLLFLFVGLCFIPAFLSNSVIDKMKISDSTIIYKKIGVGVIQRLTQNGEIVNRMIRKRYPKYKALYPDRKSLKGLIGKTYVFEKFHLMLFLFFLLIDVYAFYKGLSIWGVVIFLLNLLYNVYPILLQQYIRLKLALYLEKNKTKMPAAVSNVSNGLQRNLENAAFSNR